MVRVLHAVDAAFESRGERLVPPFSLAVCAGERAVLPTANERAAAIAARMVAGIVKPTTGNLFIGDFDPRIQPVQAKRAIGFVPHGGRFGDAPREPLFAPRIDDAIDLHAALYEVERESARRAAFAVISAFDRADEEVVALALALIRPVVLLVLDRPRGELLAGACALRPETAIVSTGAVG